MKIGKPDSFYVNPVLIVGNFKIVQEFDAFLSCFYLFFIQKQTESLWMPDMTDQ